ncbi:MAG: hypothetical protein HYX69_01060 [Planctomycetia bacterium]|nr:hypothetical protein [Planctomycetia bacterium]
MTPKITAEMRAALEQHPGQPLAVEDDQTRKVYLLVDAEQGRTLAEQWIREQLQIGLAAADRGEVIPFDPEAIKAGGREHLPRGR